MKRIFKLNIVSALLVASFAVCSCNDFLDVAPDNRTELDSQEKITAILRSGYTTHYFTCITEMMSDNTDHKITPATLTAAYQWQQDVYNWEDTKDESGNDDPKDLWESCYGAIATANQALDAIDQAGNPEEMNPQRGEALMIRAYHHFILINVFALAYSEKTGTQDLGLPYAEFLETTVNPVYERGNVADFYAKIEKDIEEGLPLIDDNIYDVPSYHFNRTAAYAFAARFYLFYRKYDKVIEYANKALGDDLSLTLRNFKIFPTLISDVQTRAREYCNPNYKCNFMLHALYSNMGIWFANYTTAKKYQHGLLPALYETLRSPGPWRTTDAYTSAEWYYYSSSYTSSNYVILPKLASDFEYTDPVSGVGYQHTTVVALYGDETLLCRAEAYIMKQQYDLATADLATWMVNHSPRNVPLTREKIFEVYDAMKYYEPDAPTPKKRLNPDFEIVSKEQENFLHCVLHFRRIETIHEGLRWFDVKRYGIEIYRRNTSINGTSGDNFEACTDTLLVNDPRRALQLPASVISAGLAANPRK